MESPAFSLQFALRECATSILLLENVRTRLVEPLDTRVRYLETLKTGGVFVASCRTDCRATLGNKKRRRIHEYLSFRAAVKTDADTAAAAHTDGSEESKIGNIPNGIVVAQRGITFSSSRFANEARAAWS